MEPIYHQRSCLINLFIAPTFGIIDGASEAFETIKGVGATILSAATLGQCESLRKAANKTSHATYILSKPAQGLLRGLNINYKPSQEIAHSCLFYDIAAPFFTAALEARKNGRTWTERHLISRIAALAFAIAAVVTRIVDLAVGILSFVAAVLFLGLSARINDLAVSQINFLDVIDALCRSLRLICYLPKLCTKKQVVIVRGGY